MNVEIKSSGQTNYQVVNGTYYRYNTPDKVIQALETARINGVRIKLYLGDNETGLDWNEQYDVTGTIGRSSGEVKIPILLTNKRSSGGGVILDRCIVKITTSRGKVLYEHPLYTGANQ